MYEILRADKRHKPDINRLIRNAKIGSGFSKDEAIQNFWIVRDGNKVIACAGLDFYRGNAVLTTLVVDKEFRHQGIGGSLIKHRLNFAKRRGAKMIALVTMYYHFNFYKRRGFKTCPRIKLPESIRSYPQFTAQRYKKCAVMFKLI